MTTATRALAAASEKLGGALNDLQDIDLRKARGNPDLREAVQDARAAAEEAQAAAIEALQLEATHT